MNLADLYRQHRAELLSLYIVHVQRLGWYKSAQLHWQEKEQAKRYIELHAPVCLGAAGIVHLTLGEELLLKEHELFFIFFPPGCGWDLRGVVNANMILPKMHS